MKNEKLIKPLVKDSLPLPLYYQLKEEIRNAIMQGEYEIGAKIPGEFQLIEMYGVSRITVGKAVSELVNEGLLCRVPGRGTFVSKPKERFHSHQIVGIAMVTHGHVYGPVCAKIIRDLTKHEYYCVILDVPSESDEEAHSKVKSLIDKNPEVVVVDGHDVFPFEALDGYNGKIIFIYRADSDKTYDCDYVMTDYYKGGRIVAEHFISRGHKRIIYISHQIRERQKSRLSLMSGIADAFRDSGLPAESFVRFPHKNDEKKIRELLVSAKKPLAVFCDEDSIAKPIYSLARDLKMRIPEDISVMGYYNTPWCDIFHPRLTSVSIRESDMAEIVVDRIVNNYEKHDKFFLEPKLIDKGSVCEI